jgi:hypothetical protein
VSKSKNLLKPHPITKTDCKARLNACICLDGTVSISRIVFEHNHVSITKTNFCFQRSIRHYTLIVYVWYIYVFSVNKIVLGGMDKVVQII